MYTTHRNIEREYRKHVLPKDLTLIFVFYRTAQHEEIVRRVRYPRHVGRDGLVRPYIFHEAMGFYILNVIFQFLSILH